MKKLAILATVLVAGLISCKEKETENKEDTPEGYFPVLAFIKSQVAHVDTSLYSIMKITYRDSTRSDTEFVKRDQFRDLAKDFLDLPDISDKKVGARFTQEKMFDETMNRVILNYKPKDIDKEELQKMQVLISPNIAQGDRISSIIIEKIKSDRNGYLQQNLLWQADKSFQIITLTRKPGEAETSTTTKVSWNEPTEQ